jgi:putative endonuclease
MSPASVGLALSNAKRRDEIPANAGIWFIGSSVNDQVAYVYILASREDGVLYIGATTDLIARAYQHRIEAVEGFAKKYRASRLVYYEVHEGLEAAFLRELQMKTWKRAWKIDLIKKCNPDWSDLYPAIARQ